MKIKIKNGSDARRDSRFTARALPMRSGRLSLQTAAAARRTGPFRPLDWPGTPRDVAWGSEPWAAHGPSGWWRPGIWNEIR